MKVDARYVVCSTLSAHLRFHFSLTRAAGSVLLLNNVKHKYYRLAQWVLNQWGASPKLKEDGVFGNKSKKAAQKILGIRFERSNRYVALIVQKVCNKHDDIPELKEDGWWGPSTEHGADLFIVKLGWQNAPPPRPDDQSELHVNGGATIRCWNPNTSQLTAAYGGVGTNLGMVNLPYVMKLDWSLNEVVTRFTAHQAAVKPFENALKGVLNHYGLAKVRELGLDRFGGCYNKRKKRGGSTWSTHAWGIAIDLHPSRNKLRWGSDQALFAQQKYDPFFKIFETEGFVSLGRCYNFDYMHLQLNP